MDAKVFGNFIAAARKEKGLTQKQVAELIHVSDKAISKWECGLGFPSIDLLEPLANALDLSLLELMKSEHLQKHQIEVKEADDIVKDYLTTQNSHQNHLKGLLLFALRVLLFTTLIFFTLTGLGYVISYFTEINIVDIPFYLPDISISGIIAVVLENTFFANQR